MPRVKLGTPTPAQQLATMNKIIKKAMVDQEIEDCTVLALRMGMDPQVARRRRLQGRLPEFTITQEGGFDHVGRVPEFVPKGTKDDLFDPGTGRGADWTFGGESETI